MNEIEFFEAFNIKPRARRVLKSFGFPSPEIDTVIEYPEITDDKLLQMVFITLKYKNSYRLVNSIKDLREQTLKSLISLKDMLSIYAEIQRLFKEG